MDGGVTIILTIFVIFIVFAGYFIYKERQEIINNS